MSLIGLIAADDVRGTSNEKLAIVLQRIAADRDTMDELTGAVDGVGGMAFATAAKFVLPLMVGRFQNAVAEIPTAELDAVVTEIARALASLHSDQMPELELVAADTLTATGSGAVTDGSDGVSRETPEPEPTVPVGQTFPQGYGL